MAKVAPLHTSLRENLYRARFQRKVARFIALNSIAGDANLLPKIILDDRGGLAFDIRDTADPSFEQPSKCLAALGHSLAFDLLQMLRVHCLIPFAWPINPC